MTVKKPEQQAQWSSGGAYEPYVGRWSRLVAQKFIAWLAVPPGQRWLDIGCGTGALCETILQFASPGELLGIDRSNEYVDYSRQKIQDGRARFKTGDAQALPVETATMDAVVSGLVLNFIPDPGRAVAEMIRVVSPGGMIAVYVWDYAGKMQLMRLFWNAAAALDPAALELDEGRRFPICKPEPLVNLFESSGLQEVEVIALDIDTDFKDFEDYWAPFLGGQGPAPSYVRSLNEEQRTALRDRLHTLLPIALDGTVPLVARAWAVRGYSQGISA